jgi:hypothetical protein
LGNRAKKQAETSVNAGRLAALLDKLVAVNLDLERLCGTSTARPRVSATPQAITEACEILQSAIADLRNIVHQAEGWTAPPEAIPKRRRSP